jgi:biotin transport system substrate-specific component
MTEISIDKLRAMALSSLMAALTAVGAYLQIPIGPVPVVLQNLFVLLAGLLLGFRWGMMSVAIYLLLGAAGLPVFAGGKGGLGHFLGPTGGYLLGFLAAAGIAGWIAERSPNRPLWDIAAVVTGSLAIYGVGVPWLKLVTAVDWRKAVVVGMLPFLVGDILKAAAAVVLARSLRQLLSPPGKKVKA